MNEKFTVIKSRHILLIAISIILLLAIMMLIYILYFRGRIGPEQPIHFSHRVHVHDKGISCFMCHDGAVNTRQANIPPLQTCILCHDRIITRHPEIQRLQNHYYKNITIAWNRAQEKLPDFVYFNHSVHVHRKIDCSACHGNIKEMDRVEKVNDFSMGFCIKCHQEQKASTDCYTCHR